MRPVVFTATLHAAAPVLAGATTAPSASWANTVLEACDYNAMCSYVS